MSSPPQPDDSHYRLDTSTSATLLLASGRKLGYAEYGASDGQPIICLHGFPGSRLEASALDHVASALGARLIALDRPGYGRSTPDQNRTLLSHAADVAALAGHLRLTQYSVLGISGGGPYALACAHALPAEQLRAVAIVCGLGPPDMGYEGMAWFRRLGWSGGARWFPGICPWWFGRQPGARLDLSEEERLSMLRRTFEKDRAKMHPKDAAVFGDPDFMAMHLRSSAEAFKQGMKDGLSQDFSLLNADFGFRIEDIRKDLPVYLWHGRWDTYVPLLHSQKVAARLGDNAHLRVSDDTHASIWADHKEEYLGELVRAMTA